MMQHVNACSKTLHGLACLMQNIFAEVVRVVQCDFSKIHLRLVFHVFDCTYQCSDQNIQRWSS